MPACPPSRETRKGIDIKLCPSTLPPSLGNIFQECRSRSARTSCRAHHTTKRKLCARRTGPPAAVARITARVSTNKTSTLRACLPHPSPLTPHPSPFTDARQISMTLEAPATGNNPPISSS